MCGRFSITSPPEALRALFNYIEQPNFPPRYNIAPTQPVPIIRMENGQRHFALVRWGLVPGWQKETPKSLLFNARAETINQKPSFRGAFRHRRALLPTDGFYEWKTVGRGETAYKQPYYIRRRDQKPFAMGVIWEDWLASDGSEIETCAVITTQANATLKSLHARMPVILAPEDWEQWLASDGTTTHQAEDLLRPAPEDLLELFPVDPEVNKAAADHAGLNDPLPDEDTAVSSPTKTKAQTKKSKANKGQFDLF
ncbi:MAG: SOS response-associated peptidase [Parvibaculaceae bacterium]|nr:SOS response-associated peptidase [Parvibaculaceae bacterium]